MSHTTCNWTSDKNSLSPPSSLSVFLSFSSPNSLDSFSLLKDEYHQKHDSTLSSLFLTFHVHGVISLSKSVLTLHNSFSSRDSWIMCESIWFLWSKGASEIWWKSSLARSTPQGIFYDEGIYQFGIWFGLVEFFSACHVSLSVDQSCSRIWTDPFRRSVTVCDDWCRIDCWTNRMASDAL